MLWPRRGYMDVVKVLELVGGVLVLSGRLVPLGLVILTPVAVNILFFEIFLLGQPGLGVVLTALCIFLIWAYRSHFARGVRREAEDRVIWSAWSSRSQSILMRPIRSATSVWPPVPGCAPRTTAAGDGFVVDAEKRLLVTCRHVVADRTKVDVIFPVGPRRRTRHRPARVSRQPRSTPRARAARHRDGV